MVREEHQWQTRLGRMPSSTIPQTDEQIEAARAKVREIQRTLKPFQYSVQLNDGVKRTRKEAQQLSNGAEYTGEWNAEGQKDGKGT